MTPERELLLLLAASEERRERTRDRLSQLAASADWGRLAGELERQRMLALCGPRAIEVAGEEVPGWFRQGVEATVRETRHQAALLEAVTLRIAGRLEAASIPALPLKGPLLARQVYGDAGARPAKDLDLLVPALELWRAAEIVVAEEGYAPPSDRLGRSGLPQLHLALAHAGGSLPDLELHWRIHWVETAFSRALLEASRPDPELGRVPAADDGLAALLLLLARDGMVGLRLAADAAAWCDAHARELEDGALARHVRTFPEIRLALLAAAHAAERLVGLPAGRLLAETRPPERRVRLAGRMANWSIEGDSDEVYAVSTLVDWLVTPPGEQLAFVRRTLFPPAAVMREFYGGGVRGLVGRMLHAPKLLLRYAQALARVRGPAG